MDKEQKSFMYFALIVILVAMILVFSSFKIDKNKIIETNEIEQSTTSK